MKKKTKWPIVGVVLAGILALAGCGGASSQNVEKGTQQGMTPEEYRAEVQEMLETADGFTGFFIANISMGGSEETVTKADIALVENPLSVKVENCYEYSGEEQKSSTYLEEKEDSVSLYMDYGGEWTEMTLPKTDAMASVQIYDIGDNMKLLLAAAENLQQEETEGNFYQISGVIPEEKLYSVEQNGRFFQLAGMSGLSESYFKGTGDVPVSFRMNLKTGEPVSYRIDLSKALEIVTNNVLTELNGGAQSEGMMIEKYEIYGELTRLGNVQPVEIPAAAKSSAINYEKEISLLESADGK